MWKASYNIVFGADSLPGQYMVADRVAAPVDYALHFTERLLMMPHTYVVNDYRQQVCFTSNQRYENLLYWLLCIILCTSMLGSTRQCLLAVMDTSEL